jgi:hypothetical protein
MDDRRLRRMSACAHIEIASATIRAVAPERDAGATLDFRAFSP